MTSAGRKCQTIKNIGVFTTAAKWMDGCMSESDQLCNVIYSRILHVKVVFYANARS